MIHFAIRIRRALAMMALALIASGASAKEINQYDFRIVITDQKEDLEGALKLIKKGNPFEMVTPLNKDEAMVRSKGKYVGTQKDLQAELLHELESLKPGEVSKAPRHFDFGWFIVKLEKVTQVDDGEELMRQREIDAKERQERLERQQKELNQQKAEYEKAKEVFEACARRAVRLEGEQKDFTRRAELAQLRDLTQREAYELTQEQIKLNKKIRSFNEDCKELRYNEEIVKICKHPAYQTQWCDQF